MCEYNKDCEGHQYEPRPQRSEGPSETGVRPGEGGVCASINSVIVCAKCILATGDKDCYAGGWEKCKGELFETQESVLLKSAVEMLRESHQRFVDYEMDVDCEAPIAHRKFMARLKRFIGV